MDSAVFKNGRDDLVTCPNRAAQGSAHFGFTYAWSVRNRNFQAIKIVFQGFDLHFNSPAVRLVSHSQGK